MSIEDRLAQVRVVPIVQANAPGVAVPTARALVAGGLDVLEVVLRTDQALDCIRAIVDDVGSAVVGAGTVLNAAQAERALDAGAGFLVAPGLDEDTVRLAQDRDIPIYPGVATASEVQRAWNLGLGVVKVFPASLVGGVPALKAFGSVFRGMRFMPTGGVDAGNLADYLAVPSVLACGGSWLAPVDLVEAGDFDAITRRAVEAVAIARG